MNHKDRFAGRELNWTGSGQGRMDGLLGDVTTLLTHDLQFLESPRPHHSSGNMLNVMSSNAD